MKSVIGVLFLILSINAQNKIDFDLKMLSGDNFSFGELSKNKVVLVNFWALWCKPCRTEMKALNNIYKKYEDKNFTIIGINIDTPRSNSKVEPFVKTLDIKYNIALDPNSEIFNRFNGQVLPLNILFNSNGEEIFRHTGYLPGDEIKVEKEIEKILSGM